MSEPAVTASADQAKSVVLLMGPTAAGKTGLAVDLVARAPVDLISVDSALVYRGMDIGTAKPDRQTLARAPHALIDLCDPAERYSAGRFVVDALAEIEASHAAGRVPVLVGGTMLYYRVLRQGLADMPDADPAVRARIDAAAAADGWPAQHARLAAVDPTAAARIHPNDSQRIQRALEVFEVAGVPLSELQQAGTRALDGLRFHTFALTPPARATLHARIETRLDDMLAEGFVDEVAGLYARGDLTPSLPSIRAVGYRQLWEHVAGRASLAEARQAALVATRQLAKRQMTWLRRENDAIFLDNSDLSGYTRALEQIVSVTCPQAG